MIVDDFPSIATELAKLEAEPIHQRADHVSADPATFTDEATYVTLNEGPLQWLAARSRI